MASDPASPSDAVTTTASTTASAGTSPSERHRLGLSSLTVRLVSLALLLAGGTTLTVGALSYGRARAALAAAADARLELLGRDVAQALHRELSDHAADITTWARLETMVALTYDDVDKELAELLRQTIGSAAEYVAIVAIAADGRVIATAGSPPDVDAPRPGTTTNLALLAGDGADVLRLDTPVYHPRRPEERIGMLASFVDPDQLLQRVTADRIVSAETTVTLHTRARPVATTDEPPAGDAFEKQAAVPRIVRVVVPELHVVVRQSRDAALAGVYGLRRTLVRMGLVVLLLSGLVGVVFAWRLSAPIRRLTAAVERVSSAGQPEHLADLPTAGGEVGVLTEAFDSMMERLAASRREVIAQSRLALLGEIAASIAHDVRTPLAALKTSAQLLANPDLSDEEQRDLAEMVASEADRVNGVVTNLVDLARTRRREHVLEPIRGVVERVAAVLRPWAHARGITIDVSGSESMYVLVDAKEIQQALLNVVHNAAQASISPGRVTIRWREDDDAALIEVGDSGPGFSDEALERAFSSFFTTKTDGTGLGLAIAKRIVGEHGGEIGARNQPGGGACVWVRLPLARGVRADGSGL